ncbi:Uncharacterised protein [Chryseobacterium indoltheticum]|uniref:YhcG N-terminal domain-containing protein n=1 Tax=Chryseobacterium indoltheticum TaxID=254 RepID=A0A381FRG8_9FLAO|nr:Uncharacterised protein [Chryseobacterium indoltheticum]
MAQNFQNKFLFFLNLYSYDRKEARIQSRPTAQLQRLLLMQKIRFTETIILMYWEIGQLIIEDEQNGELCAK